MIKDQDVNKIIIPYENLSVENVESPEKVLRLITANPQISTKELAEACGLTSDGVFYQTKKLRESGFIKREGGRKEDRWKVLK